MADSILTRISRAWNVFRGNEYYTPYSTEVGVGYGVRPDRLRMSIGNEQSIVAPMYNRIGIDVASSNIAHVRLDENGRFKDIIESGLNNCLTVEANLDQTSRSFMQDAAMSMCDEGTVAIVPIDTTINPRKSSSYDILTMRTGEILQWHPKHVLVRVYNDNTGMFENLTLEKTTVAIVENPLYAVMNEPNSTLKRLIEKLNLLDAIDRQSGAGKLDVIIQLPYVIKTEKRQQQAENRRLAIQSQLMDSQYGIAYTDGTERITQLNRPADNNLMGQVEYLTRMLYSQLGLTEAIFNGTADEEEWVNYYNRTVEPILAAITDAMKRVFLTKTARSQGQSIVYIRDPFKYVSPGQLPDMVDKFTRNEVMSSNEFRAVIGLKPSTDPKADELRNKNINEKVEKPTEEEPVKLRQNGSRNGRSSIEHVQIKS